MLVGPCAAVSKHLDSMFSWLASLVAWVSPVQMHYTSCVVRCGPDAF